MVAYISDIDIDNKYFNISDIDNIDNKYLTCAGRDSTAGL